MTVCSYSTCPRAIKVQRCALSFALRACQKARALSTASSMGFMAWSQQGSDGRGSRNGEKRTTCMRPGSTPSRFAERTSASTFSCVLLRYPIILAALAAFCAGEAAERICPSVTDGYIDNQNWRRNSLAAVWHVVNWRKRPSGMSSVGTQSEASFEMKYKILRTFTHLHLQARGHIFGHCDERCVACLIL